MRGRVEGVRIILSLMLMPRSCLAEVTPVLYSPLDGEGEALLHAGHDDHGVRAAGAGHRLADDLSGEGMRSAVRGHTSKGKAVAQKLAHQAIGVRPRHPGPVDPPVRPVEERAGELIEAFGVRSHGLALRRLEVPVVPWVGGIRGGHKQQT